MEIVIDLGTANFRGAVIGRDEIMDEPTVVARYRDSTVIGSEAAKMVGRNPELVEILHPVEWGAVKDLEGAVDVIRHTVKSFAPSGFARRFHLTLAVPASLTQVERKAMEEAGRAAGARTVRLESAAVAAALGAQLPIETPTGCLVVNLGAGVTEAAILSLKGLVDSHSVNVGGRSIDRAIVEVVKKQYNFLVGDLSAERLKRQCGDTGAADILEVRGRSLVTGLPDNLAVPRSIVEDELNAYCETIVELIVQTLSTCPPELVGDIVERGIVLVGGGANVTRLVARLTARTEVPVIVADNPEHCVIRGLLRMVGWNHKPGLLRTPRWSPQGATGVAKSLFGGKES